MEKALGMIETRGLIGALEAADAALKAAAVVLERRERAGGALVTIMLRGEVAAVQAAVEAGARAAARVGRLVAAHVIPRPDEETERSLGGRGGSACAADGMRDAKDCVLEPGAAGPAAPAGGKGARGGGRGRRR